MYKEIRCQINECPYGMGQARCCFCEIQMSKTNDPPILRTKCKKDNHRMVYVKIETPNPDEAA